MLKIKLVNMKTHKTPLSINILYWLSNFSLVMLSLGFFAAIVFNIFIYTGTFDSNITIDAPFPVKVDYLDAGKLISNNQDVKIELVDATARLKIIDAPNSILKKIGFIMIFSILFAVLLIVIFRKFIKNVKAGNIFTIENINLLKFLSYGLVAVWVFQAILMRALYFYMADQLEFKDTSLRIDLTQYSSTLIIALVIWVLAHIFLTGVRLQEEKDLTI